MLRTLIVQNRDEILARARERVAKRHAPVSNEDELANGLPMFLSQLCEALRKATSDERMVHADLDKSAHDHGHDLFHRGATVAQVVHDYGDLSQVITDFALEQHDEIPASELRTLSFCVDEAIAGAVTSFAQQHDQAASREGTERLGLLAHEMRSLVSTAILSFATIKDGIVAPRGSTSAIHERSLMRLSALVDSSLAEVRLDAGMQSVERVSVRRMVEEVEIGGQLISRTRGMQLLVTTVDDSVIVEADRQILTAALANLLHNAFTLTRPRTTVRLRASATATRVLIEVEDESGGLTQGRADELIHPSSKRGEDRSPLGVGLMICVKAVAAIGGEIRATDVPGKGCIFTIDLPKQPASDDSCCATS